MDTLQMYIHPLEVSVDPDFRDYMDKKFDSWITGDETKYIKGGKFLLLISYSLYLHQTKDNNF